MYLSRSPQGYMATTIHLLRAIIHSEPSHPTMIIIKHYLHFASVGQLSITPTITILLSAHLRKIRHRFLITFSKKRHSGHSNTNPHIQPPCHNNLTPQLNKIPQVLQLGTKHITAQPCDRAQQSITNNKERLSPPFTCF